MDREDIISDVLRDGNWKDAECKFCFVEYMLCYASCHVWLVTFEGFEQKIH